MPRWIEAAIVCSAVVTSASCGGDYASMNIAITGLQDALGTWPNPTVINLVVYTPRTTGAPAAMPRQQDPDWNPATEERRITAWTGADRQVFTAYFWRGTIERVRVRAVIATGSCGGERTVIADGENSSAGWMSGGSDVGVAMRPAVRVIDAASSNQGCP
jgi:hypothetical protein